MTNDEKKELTEHIGKELAALVGTIEELTEASKPIPPNNAIGRVSRMEAINSRSISEQALQAALIKQQNLNNSLKKIADEKFGECRKCGDDIGLKRLLLMPESVICMECVR
jgi:DnaK suppressor protein